MLKDRFGAFVEGNLLYWVNCMMRICNTYAEADIEAAHMDFTTAYNTLIFSDSERNEWLQIARQKLVTHAMLLEKGILTDCTMLLVLFNTHTHTTLMRMHINAHI